MEQNLEESRPADPAVPGDWVVGTDGSESAERAARWAADHAVGRARAIRLTRAWKPVVIPDLTGSMAMPDIHEWLEHGARTETEELGQRLETCRVPVEIDIRSGVAAGVLLDAAQSASMLVIGSRGRGGFHRLVLGSTSSQCAAHSPVPVAIVAGTAPSAPSRRITVAVDGSDSSCAAARWARTFATDGMTVELLTVEDGGQVGDDLRDDIAALVADAPEGVAMSHRVVDGPVRPTLLDAAQTADLLVMGARGRGALGAALLGSVSTWLLHNVARPMVVVPRP